MLEHAVLPAAHCQVHLAGHACLHVCCGGRSTQSIHAASACVHALHRGGKAASCNDETRTHVILGSAERPDAHTPAERGAARPTSAPREGCHLRGARSRQPAPHAAPGACRQRDPGAQQAAQSRDLHPLCPAPRVHLGPVRCPATSDSMLHAASSKSSARQPLQQPLCPTQRVHVGPERPATTYSKLHARLLLGCTAVDVLHGALCMFC